MLQTVVAGLLALIGVLLTLGGVLFKLHTDRLHNRELLHVARLQLLNTLLPNLSAGARHVLAVEILRGLGADPEAIAGAGRTAEASASLLLVERSDDASKEPQ